MSSRTEQRRVGAGARAAQRLLPASADPGLQALASLAARLLRTSSAEVSLITEVRTIAAGGGAAAGRTGERTALSEALCPLAAAGEVPFVVDDAASDERVAHLGPVRRGEVGAYLAAPLLADTGERVGALCVYQYAPRAWTAAEAELLQHLAAAAAAQLETAALIQSFSTEDLGGGDLDDAAASGGDVGGWLSTRLGQVARFALSLADTSDLEELVGAVAEQGLVLLGCNGGSVAVPEDDDDPHAAPEQRFVIARLTSSYGPAAQDSYGRLPLSTRLPLYEAARTGRTVLVRDEAECLAYSPLMADVVEATGSIAFAAVPLRVDGQVLGVVTCGWAQAQSFEVQQLALLETFAAQCAQALARVRSLAAERAAAAKVAGMAEALQRSLLTELPEPDHLELVARYVPAADQAQVGGDWYDAFMVRDGTTCLVVGDVTGHDQRAAVAMAQVRNVLRGVAHAIVQPPAAILHALDWAMRDLAIGALSTAVLAKVEQGQQDAERGLRTLRWSSAGHPPPLLIHPDGRAELLERAQDLLLGLVVDTERYDHTVTLAPGSTVLLYTDGLIERRGEDLETGLARLRRVAQELAHLPVQHLCDELVARLATGSEDDVALLAVRAHPEDRPRPAQAGPRRLPADLTREAPTAL
ncbi:SpoIIE family protein phosphatase [Kineococcus sp. SYSU DK005]|uniref:SpoIIE family protein phosphatase n=1 Tax=Kineococcus sp. SYSU DK005 TaxID=3383126 RepID=UPI003D7C9CD1